MIYTADEEAKIRDEAQDNGDNVLPSFLYAQIWQDHNLARFGPAEAGASGGIAGRPRVAGARPRGLLHCRRSSCVRE